MPTYLVEAYLADAAAAHAAVERARGAAAAMSRSGTPIQHVQAFHVPADETTFHVVEGAALQHVRELCERAGVSGARIVAAVSQAPGTRGATG